MKLVTPLLLLSLFLANLNSAPADEFDCPDEWTHSSNAVTYHGPYDTQAAAALAVATDGKKAIEDEEATQRALCPTECGLPPPKPPVAGGTRTSVLGRILTQHSTFPTVGITRSRSTSPPWRSAGASDQNEALVIANVKVAWVESKSCSDVPVGVRLRLAPTLGQQKCHHDWRSFLLTLG